MSAQIRYYRDGAFVEDVWSHLGDEDSDTASGPVFVSKARFLENREAFLSRTNGLGVRLEPGEDIFELAPFLDRINAVAVAFPKYTDGRGYSTARLLRERYGYKGEIRAVGDVLIDQVHFMLRCGINALEITNPHTARILETEGLKGVKQHYQPAALDEARPAGATRPWLRQSQ